MPSGAPAWKQERPAPRPVNFNTAKCNQQYTAGAQPAGAQPTITRPALSLLVGTTGFQAAERDTNRTCRVAKPVSTAMSPHTSLLQPWIAATRLAFSASSWRLSASCSQASRLVGPCECPLSWESEAVTSVHARVMMPWKAYLCAVGSTSCMAACAGSSMLFESALYQTLMRSALSSS